MRAEPEDVLGGYAAALAEYLRTGGEAEKAAAYSLGRSALAGGVGLLQLIELHQRVGVEGGEGASRSLEFLAEVIGPYEMALRGYREANASLRALSSSLQAEVEQRTRALREAEQRFRSLVEHLPAVTYVATGNPPVMRYLSPQLEELAGRRPGQVVEAGSGWLDWIEPMDLELVEQSFAELEPGTRARLEYRIRRPDGALRWIRDEALVIASSEYGGAARQGIWTDITELRALEDQLRHAQKMEAIGHLAGGVAHDFNNVLTAILSFGGFVLDDLPADHPSAADVTEVVRAGERGAALTRQLLSIGRRSVTSPSLLELNAVVLDMERLLRRLIGEQISLSNRLGDDPWMVFADRGQVEQVLLNMVVNARDAMPQGGAVVVETRNATLPDPAGGQFGAPPGDYAMLAVTDTGMGMDAATRERIFEPFFTTKGVGKGTGLGLAVVANIVRGARGELVVESAPGRGTTFRVYFPRSEATSSAKAYVSDGPTTARGDETILLVEDQPEVRAAARRILVANGYQVLEAANAGEALRLASHAREITLILADVALGDWRGPELVEHMRRQRPDIRVLYMSGHGVNEVSDAEYLQKPFSPRTLAERVRAVIDQPPR